jgi:hypothetical protein
MTDKPRDLPHIGRHYVVGPAIWWIVGFWAGFAAASIAYPFLHPHP